MGDMSMTYFIQTGTETTRLTGSPTLTSLDGEERATFASIMRMGREADFGVYNVDTTPPDGKQWVGGIDGTVTPPVAVFDDIPAPSTDPRDHDLTPAQFRWLLAYTGLDDVTDDVVAYAKANDTAQYAELQLNLSESSFNFDSTMAMVSQMASVIPEGVDVSEATISAVWMVAKDK